MFRQSSFFKKWANPGLFFVYVHSFHIPIQMTNIQFEQYKLKKALVLWLGLKPGAAGWKAQTNPQRYDGTPQAKFFGTIHRCWMLKIIVLSTYVHLWPYILLAYLCSRYLKKSNLETVWSKMSECLKFHWQVRTPINHTVLPCGFFSS